MPLQTPQSLSTFVDNFLQSWAVLTGVPSVAQIPDTDPIVAIAGSNSGSALYLQSLIYQLEAFSRASTSTGVDLDSWFAQFSYTDSNGVFHGFKRPVGTPATVVIQANIQIPSGQTSVVIPSGTIFQTQAIVVQPATVPIVFQVQTTQDFIVTNSGNTNLTCYALTSIQTTDSSGNTVNGYAIYNNIPPNQFTQQFSPLAGIASVTNTASPAFGTNSASDAQARIDFVNWILSLSDATYSALVAAIEDVAGGLIPGQTFELYDYASAPSVAQPGTIVAVVIGSGSGQYPGSNPGNPTMDAIGQALINTEAFGIVGLEYYAKQYQVTSVAATFTYSQSALTEANLTIQSLQGMMTGILQALIPSSGANLGSGLFFSTLVQQWRNLTVTLSSGVVGNIITDVNANAFTIVTAGVPSGGGTFSAPTYDSVYPGNPGAINQAAYLSLATNILPTYTPISAP